MEEEGETADQEDEEVSRNATGSIQQHCYCSHLSLTQ